MGTEERKRSFLYNNDTVKKNYKNENVKEREKEPVCSIGRNVTEIQISSKKSSDSHQFMNNHAQSERAMTRGTNSVGKASAAVDNESNMKRNVNDSFLHKNARNVEVEVKDTKGETFGRKVAGYKAAFETMNKDSSASSSSSSTYSNESSPPSYKKHELSVKTVNMKKLHTKTGQNDPSVPLLASSKAIAKFLSNQQNLENNQPEEKVTSNAKYEENKSTVHKNTTNKVKNMMETSSEECDGIPTGIGKRKAFFDHSGSASNLNEKKSMQAINIERVNKTKSDYMKT